MTTASDDDDLAGYAGNVTITRNPDPKVSLNLSCFNAHQNGDAGNLEILALFNNPSPSAEIDSVVDDIIANGENVLCPGALKTRLFNINYPDYKDWDLHNSKNSDLDTFAQLDLIIIHVHSRSLHVHFWARGDDFRKQTPIGVDGINGISDKATTTLHCSSTWSLAGLVDGLWFRFREMGIEQPSGGMGQISA